MQGGNRLIGQQKLYTTLTNLIKNNKFPQVMLLEGKIGCGKHTLVQELSTQLNIEVIDITNKVELDTINEIILEPIKYLYLVDVSQISIREQNILLKLLEEPPVNCYIVLLCTGRNEVLPTVLNRCQYYSFNPYTQEELKQFTEDESIIEYVDTPGLIKELSKYDIQSLVQLCEKIFLKIQQASCSNILTIPGKLNFTKEVQEDKFGYGIFICVLKNVGLKLYKQNSITYPMYELCEQLYKDSFITNINKQHLFEHFLINLKVLVGV